MAKKKSNFKEFDYKKFLLEKGEIVGIGVAGAVMALLLIGGVFKSMGASPSKNATRVAAAATAKKSALDNPNNRLPASYKVFPSDLVAAVNPRPLDPDQFALPNPWFKTSALEDTKWREPPILAVGPATYEIVQSELAKLAFNSDGTVDVRVSESDSSSNESKTKRMTEGMDDKTAKRLRRSQLQQERLQAYLQLISRGGGGRGGNGMMGGRGGMLGAPPMGGMQQMGGAPMMATQFGNPGNPGGGKSGLAGGSSEKYEIRSATIDEALKKNLPLGRVAAPAIQAVISAEFPYKKQMEAIRKALHYPSVAAMLADPKVWIQKGDEQHPDLTINFLGFRVWRQATGPDGQVVQKWQPVDLETPYLAARLYHDKDKVRSASDNDAVLKQHGLIVTDVPSRLVWPLLPLLRTDEKYADVVAKLPDLKSTLDKLKKESQAEEGNKPPPNPYVDKDPFEDDEANPSGPKSGVPGAPGAGAPGLAPPSFQGGAPGNRADMMKKFGGAGPGGPGAPRPPMSGPPGFGNKLQGPMPAAPGMMSAGGNAAALPEWCLVRFVDVTVQPGMTYEYKVQLRLANPLYNRKDQAVSEGLTFAKEIYGPDDPQPLTTVKDGKRTALKVHVPDNPSVYAVDERPANARYVPPAGDDRVAVQIHWWISSLNLNKVSREPIGEWAIAERQLARRGEYIGHPQRIELPFWSERDDKFLFATEARGSRRQRGVLLNFTTGGLLVDFDGGKVSYNNGTRPLTYDAPVEMLVMTPDGRLIVRNSAVDTPDEERKKRVEAWRARHKAVKEAIDEEKNNTQNPAGKGNPFNVGVGGGKGR